MSEIKKVPGELITATFRFGGVVRPNMPTKEKKEFHARLLKSMAAEMTVEQLAQRISIKTEKGLDKGDRL